jgi:glycosyltransferase involved in cell wall biosynthesis
MEISVVICSHNPRPAYLRRVLDSLRAQTLAREIWELLLVDNASPVPLESAWDLSWHPHARHLRETVLGVAIARRTGMRSASADLIVFVDDDNVLAADYLKEALRIKGERPEIGAWGSGSIIPEFESSPSKYVQKLVPYLALRDVTAPRWGNVLPCVDMTPWGAGMCVRATVATAYREYCKTTAIQLVSRHGRQVLMSGEDVEICYVACSLGFGVGVFPSLKMIHLISHERISVDYLLRVFEGTLTSNWIIAYKWRGIGPLNHSAPRKLLSLCKQTLMLRGIDRRMYFASLRAAASAKRLIAASKLRRAADLETEADGVV